MYLSLCANSGCFAQTTMWPWRAVLIALFKPTAALAASTAKSTIQQAQQASTGRLAPSESLPVRKKSHSVGSQHFYQQTVRNPANPALEDPVFSYFSVTGWIQARQASTLVQG